MARGGGGLRPARVRRPLAGADGSRGRGARALAGVPRRRLDAPGRNGPAGAARARAAAGRPRAGDRDPRADDRDAPRGPAAGSGRRGRASRSRPPRPRVPGSSRPSRSSSRRTPGPPPGDRSPGGSSTGRATSSSPSPSPTGWPRSAGPAARGSPTRRFTLHYARTTADGRIALGGGGGRAGWGGRIGRPFSHDVGAARHAAEGLRRWFPSLADVRIEDAWGGPIDITDDHRPWFGTRPGGRVHHGLGYSGNGVAPAILGGADPRRPRDAAGRATTRRRACRSSATGRRPGRSRRSRCGPSERGSSARRPPAGSGPRRRAGRRRRSSGRSAGSRAASATTSGPNERGRPFGG